MFTKNAKHLQTITLTNLVLNIMNFIFVMLIFLSSFYFETN
jgi:hypothetical protein